MTGVSGKGKTGPVVRLQVAAGKPGTAGGLTAVGVATSASGLDRRRRDGGGGSLGLVRRCVAAVVACDQPLAVEEP